ncbi:hypothetical protein [Mesorhizobium sp. CN2-181]|uniref:hypothetical protein n=1 Tax=Mesorhizobium yinganensis TaxID=3157707 RepID=UPI0032B76C8D
MEKTIPATKARQGRKGLEVLSVLVVSLIFTFVVWAALGIWGEMIDGSAADNPGGVTTSAPQTNTKSD